MLEQDLVEARDHRDGPLRGVGLNAWDVNRPARKVHVLAVEQAELRDPDAREHERRKERRAGYVVAPPVRVSSPDLAPPDLTDQCVGDPMPAFRIGSAGYPGSKEAA
jgi:hypothetical protein